MMDQAPALTLSPNDPPVVEVLRPKGEARPIVLLCDHASNAVPGCLNGLGMDPALMQEHIGWDIGAKATAAHLVDLLSAPAICSGYSRLVIDCNRDPANPGAMPEISDGIVIPGNDDLSPADKAWRINTLHKPYHLAVSGEIETVLAKDQVPALLSIHSFTPVMDNFQRPWHIGVLWDGDPRIATPLLDILEADKSLCVGDNAPYFGGGATGHTMYRHGTARGLPHVSIELRQDLIADDAGARKWAGILAEALEVVLADKKIYGIEYWPCRDHPDQHPQKMPLPHPPKAPKRSDG